MTCRMTVRGRDAMGTWELDEWTALVMLAALAADPETLDELAAAARRYQPEHRLLEEGQPVTEIADAQWDSGPWCFVDLIGRCVIAGNDFDLPNPGRGYRAHDDEETNGFPTVWLDLKADWAFHVAEPDWRADVNSRFETAAARPPVDARAVLFGPPLLKYVVERVAAYRREHSGDDTDRDTDCARRIHADWLMTPRDDLGGRNPRCLLLADRSRINNDLQNRAVQWSKQGHAPPALPVDSAAYRFGLFGTAEVVLYFDLVRSLVTEALQLTRCETPPDPESLAAQLADHRDRWLASPQEDDDSEMSPGEMIESERRRVPMTATNRPLDCDCPICQAEAEGHFGPTFAWFDGHYVELEDEFAFSLTESREEWELEHGSFRQQSEETAQETAEPDDAACEDDAAFNSVWKSSYVNDDWVDAPEASWALAAMAVGFHLAELVGDVKGRPGGRPHVEALNGAYKSFRTAPSLTLVGSAAGRLRTQLEAVGKAYPDLVSKSADLQSRMDEALRRRRAKEHLGGMRSDP